MKTSQRPISANGEAGSTSSLEDFRASLSVMPGSAEARQMTATSGRICSAASTKSGPLGSWLRTLLASSRWSSRARFLQWRVRELYSTRATEYEDTDSSRPLPCNASATTLRVTDTKSSRCLFQLVPLEPPTDATESSSLVGEWTKLNGGLLPTPRAMEVVETPQAQANRLKDKTGDKMYNLQSAAAFGMLDSLLPTPTETDIQHKQRVEELKEAGADTMASRKNGSSRPNGLSDFFQFYGMLPTPTTGVYKNAGGSEDFWEKRKERGHQMDIAMAVYDWAKENNVESDGGIFRLSPLFTEEMMGFPFLWTTLPFLRQSGAPSPSRPTATQ